MASLKSAGQARGLETQGRADAAEFQSGVWRQDSPFLKDLSLFLLKSSTDWIRPTHIVKGNLLYSKSTDFNVNLISKIVSQQHLDWCLTKYLGTVG